MELHGVGDGGMYGMAGQGMGVGGRSMGMGMGMGMGIPGMGGMPGFAGGTPGMGRGLLDISCLFHDWIGDCTNFH